MNKKIKVAVIGVANFGRTRRQQLQHSQRFEITALYDTDPEALDIAVREDNARTYDNLEDLLANADIEAVAISTPIYCHAEQTIAALKAGKDVLVEKPISNNLADAVEMIRTAQQQGRVLMVAHNQRFDPAFGIIKKYVEDGKLGKVCAVRAIGTSCSGLTQVPGAWRTVAKLNPGGPLLQCGCHIIDTLLWLFGRIDNLQARARTDITAGDVIDCISVLATLEDGTLVTIDEYYTTAYQHEFNIYGTKANLYCDTFHRELRFQQCGMGGVEIPELIDIPSLPRSSEEWTDVVNEFYNTIREARLPNHAVSPQEALEVLNVVLTAHRSACENRQLSVEHADKILSKYP